ncbi:MAG TPA: hypothetical protein VGE86_00040 [Thermoanaerobaculia bacterium]
MRRAAGGLDLAMQIRLFLFAAVRDIVGTDAMTVELDEGTTAAALWTELRSKGRAPKYGVPDQLPVAIHYLGADEASYLTGVDEFWEWTNARADWTPR